MGINLKTFGFAVAILVVGSIAFVALSRQYEAYMAKKNTKTTK